MILFIYQIQAAVIVIYTYIVDHLTRYDNPTKFQRFILNTITRIGATPMCIELLNETEINTTDAPDVRIPVLEVPVPMDAIMAAFHGCGTGEELAYGSEDDKKRMMTLWSEFKRVTWSDTEKLANLATECIVERLKEVGYWITCVLTLLIGVGSWYLYLTSSVLVGSISMAVFTWDMTSACLFLVGYALKVPAFRTPLNFYKYRRNPVAWQCGDNILTLTIQ